MQLELGLKITKTRDEIASTSEYWLAKDRAGPVFQSSETSTIFILTAHLKGYMRNNINIKISEDGSRISISGEKPIQEMLMMGSLMLKKEVEITRFNKVFIIPDGVILDRIKAKYDEEECMLKIVMPKSVKGICGARIEEVEEEESDRGRSEVEKSVADHILKSVEEASRKRSEESEVQEIEDSESVMEKKKGELSRKIIDDVNGDTVRDTIKDEIGESKLGIKDGNGESVRGKVGKIEYEVLTTSDIEQESKQREVEESKSEIPNRLKGVEEEISMERLEAMKKSEFGPKLADHTPSNVGAISQEESEESGIQQMEKTKSVEGKMDGRESKRIPEEANNGIPKNVIGKSIENDMEQPMIETDHGDQERVREEFPQQLPKATSEESKGFSASKVQETKEVPEAMVKRKGKEIEFSVEKGESEEPKIMHVEAKRLIEKDKTKHKRQDEVQNPKNGCKDSDQQNVEENTIKGGFEVSNSSTEELPKQIGEKLLDRSKGYQVAKMEEPKDVMKEAVAETESLMERAEEASKKRTEKASRIIEKSTKETEESMIERKARDGPYVPEDISVKEEFDVLGTVKVKLPKKVVEAMAQDENDKTESGTVRLKEMESKKMHFEASDVSKQDTTIDKNEKEIGEPKLKSSDQLSEQDNEGFDGSKRRLVLPEVGETDDVKEEGPQVEQFVKKVNGEKREKIEVEANGGFRKDITRQTTHKETDGPKIQTMETDQEHLQQEMSEGRFEENKAAKGDFSMKMVDSLDNKKEGQKDTRIQEAKELKGDFVKQKSEEKEGETEAKEGGAEIKQPAKKGKRGINDNIQIETKGGMRKNMTRDITRTEIEEPQFQTKEKDQQCLQEEMREGKLEASKAANEEFPMDMVDSLVNKREGLKDTKIEKAKEVKEKLLQQKGEEKLEKVEDSKEKDATIEQFVKKVKGEKYEKIPVEAACDDFRKDITRKATLKQTKEPKIQQKDKDQQCLQEEVGKRRFEASTSEREDPLQALASLAKKREGHGDKEIKEAEEIKEDVAKRKTRETQVVEFATMEKNPESVSEKITKTSQETLETRTNERESPSTKGPTSFAEVKSTGFEEVGQGSAKDKKPKTDLLFPKLQSKETHESRNKTVNQDILKPKKAEEAAEGQHCTYNIESTRAVATTEDQVDKPSSSSWTRFPSTQQYQVEEKGKLDEDCKAKYKASKESAKEDPAKDWRNSIEMKENQESNLKPNFPLEELLKKTQHVTRKEEVHIGHEVVKETMRQGAEEPENKFGDRDQQNVQKDVGEGVGIVETLGREMPKEEYVADAGRIAGRMETQRDSTTTLAREKYMTTQNVDDAKLRIKEEFEKPDFEKVDLPHLSTKRKLPKPKEQYGYGTEDIQAPNIAVYKGAKPSELKRPTLPQQSIDEEENKKSENVVEAQESAKKITNIESNVGTAPIEHEDTLQPHILEEAPAEYVFQEINHEGPKISIDRCQQDMPEKDDKKGNLATMAEETEEPSKRLQEKERRKTTQTADDKKPKMKKTVAEFEKANEFKQVAGTMHETRESEHQRGAEDFTSRMGMEPPKVAEITPNRRGEVQQEKKGKKPIHALKATTLKEEGLAQATATHSKAKSKVEQKGEIDKPQINQLPSPSAQLLSKEPYELDQFIMKENDSKEEKYPIHSTEHTAASSEAVADNVFKKPSKLSSSASFTAQQFEAEGYDKTDARHEIRNQESQESKKVDSKIHVQDSTNSETCQEIERTEAPQPESPAEQQCINKEVKEEEGNNALHEIEEKIVNEQGDEASEEESQVAVEHNDCREKEASGGKKERTKCSMKLFVSLVVVGSALLVSLGVIFVRHRRARKR